MSKDKKILVFTSNNALVLTNPHNYDEMCLWPNVIVDPNLGEYAGIERQYLKKEGNKVSLMNELERLLRKQDIELNGADNQVRRIDQEKPKKILEIQKKAVQAVKIYWEVPTAIFTSALLMHLLDKWVIK